MKIYTKTGDDGTTGLFGGQRVSKADPRIESYGTIDELNAVIGWVAITSDAELAAALRAVQGELFTIGAHLATPADGAKANNTLPALDATSIARLEHQIDAADAVLPPLKNFILSGGSEAAARLHVARTVCRRAERLVVALTQSEPVDRAIVTFLNRLSDWLFVQARLANRRAGVEDVAWISR